MTSGVALTLLGFGLGVLVVAGRGHDRRARTTRERVVEAQQRADRAARHARELAAQWSTEERS